MKIGFIGAGNMGGAIAIAVSKRVGGENIAVSAKTSVHTAELARKIGCTAATNEFIAESCEFIFLAVKPNVLEDVLVQIAPYFKASGKCPVLVSMAAGVSTAEIARMIGFDCPIVRIMPNMPCVCGEGMTQICRNEFVTDEVFTVVKELLLHSGRVDDIEETLIDAASAVSGCGPAFVYMFIEAMADAGVECGLPRKEAVDFAAQTLIGASRTVLETGKHMGQLKDEVCSPGGTTIAGVHALENGAFRAVVMNAVKAAYDRTKRLGRGEKDND